MNIKKYILLFSPIYIIFFPAVCAHLTPEQEWQSMCLPDETNYAPTNCYAFDSSCKHESDEHHEHEFEGIFAHTLQVLDKHAEHNPKQKKKLTQNHELKILEATEAKIRAELSALESGEQTIKINDTKVTQDQGDINDDDCKKILDADAKIRPENRYYRFHKLRKLKS